jgi:hypothetical protein
VSWHWMYVRAHEIGRELAAEAARERLVRQARKSHRPGHVRTVFAGLAGGLVGYFAGRA